MDEINLDPNIPRKMFYKIGEVSRILGVKPYVLRYWESEFKQIKPAKNRFGQRVFRPKDLAILLRVKDLLYKEKFTIAGAKKQLAAERLARQQKAKQAVTEKEKTLNEADLNKFINLLKEHKTQLQEILDLIKSETNIQSETKIGA